MRQNKHCFLGLAIMNSTTKGRKKEPALSKSQTIVREDGYRRSKTLESPQTRLAEGVDDMDIISSTMVMKFRGVPVLFYACRGSRIATLKIWLRLMLRYFKDGFQSWYDMVMQVRDALKTMVRWNEMFKTLDGGKRAFCLERRMAEQRD